LPSRSAARRFPSNNQGGRLGVRYAYAFRPPDGSGRGTLRIVSGETGPAPELE